MPPVLEIHGERDSIIPYYGGWASGKPVPAIEKWLKRWSMREQCSSTITEQRQGIARGQVLKTAYKRDDDELVVGLLVRKMDHYWPSLRPNLDSQGHSAPIEAATHLLDFFDKHRKSVDVKSKDE